MSFKNLIQVVAVSYIINVVVLRQLNSANTHLEFSNIKDNYKASWYYQVD